MKFTAERAHLKAALDTVRATIADKSPLAILGNVLLATSENGLRVAATDNVMQASMKIGCHVAVQGSTTLPGLRLREIVNALPDGADVQIELSEDGNRATVKAARARFNLGALPAADFPLMRAAKDGPSFELPASAWKQALARVLFAAEPGANRAYIEGLTLDPVRVDGERCIRFMCMSNLGMAHETFPADTDDFPARTIPNKSAQVIAGLIGGCAPEETIKLTSAGSLLLFEVGARGFITSTAWEDLPAYETFPPYGAPNVLKTDAGVLEDAIKRVMIVGAQNSLRRVVFEIDGDQMTVSARGDDGNEASEPVDCEFDGLPVRIAFNGGNFLDHLTRIRSENVILRFGDPKAPHIPCLMAADGPSNAVHVVMQMRLT